MSDQNNPKEERLENIQPAEELLNATSVQPAEELSEEELNNVAGGKGKASPGDFNFTHIYDKSSPVL